MRPKPLILLALLLAICAVALWTSWPAMVPVTTGEGIAIAQSSPLLAPDVTPGATLEPTPLSLMSTPAVTLQAQADWPRYTSPYLGFSFLYPPERSVEGPEAKLEGGNVPAEATYTNMVGSPTWINPAPGKLGGIYMILNYYRRSPDTSLAEWVLLNNRYSAMNSMWGFSPLELATIPADSLPAGIDEGIYTVNDWPYNPQRTIWLQRGDLVYSLSSTYNRPEETALILAVVKSLEFDPAVEAVVRESNGFQGNDETFRLRIAEAEAQTVASCDASCEYNNYMLEVERWKTLSALERPLVQPVLPTTIDDSWQTYTQTLLGLSFRYAEGLEITDPFAEITLDENNVPENNVDRSTLFDKAITIRHKSWSQEVMKIELFPYTTSGDLPFNNWEAIQDQLDRAHNPLNRFQYRLIVPIDWGYVGHYVDDIVHTQDQAPYYRIENFWLNKDGIVFRITSSYPAVAYLAAGIISTMQFDTAQLERLRELGIFAGDERAMATELMEAWANPLPTVDPQATATPIPTTTPRPTAIPTPAIRLTVTPSAFNSPLVNGLQQYHGLASDGYYRGSDPDNSRGTPYRLLYDPATWQWVANEMGSTYLAHQQIAGCELSPGILIYEVPLLAPVELAGQEWNISYGAGDGELATALLYSVGWEDGFFQASLSLAEPLPAPYDPANKSQCQRDAEAVLDTFTYQAVPTSPTDTPTTIPDSTPAPPDPTLLLPTVTATP